MNARRLAWLDIFKGIAILSIVVFHFFQNYSERLSWVVLGDKLGVRIAYIAVDLFIIIAGFNIIYSFCSKAERDSNPLTAIDWIAWLKKRAMRLYPTYWLAIAITLILYLWADKAIKIQSVEQWISIALGFPNYNLYRKFNPGFWFFSVLVQLYLLTPVLVKGRGLGSRLLSCFYTTKDTKQGRYLTGRFQSGGNLQTNAPGGLLQDRSRPVKEDKRTEQRGAKLTGSWCLSPQKWLITGIVGGIVGDIIALVLLLNDKSSFEFVLQDNLFISYIFQFCFGLWAGYIYFENRSFSQSHIKIAASLFVGGMLSYWTLGTRFELYYKLGFDLLFSPFLFLGACLILERASERFSTQLIARGLARAGKTSYPIYLIHQPLLFVLIPYWVRHLALPANYKAIAVLTIATILLSLYVFLFTALDSRLQRWGGTLAGG